MVYGYIQSVALGILLFDFKQSHGLPTEVAKSYTRNKLNIEFDDAVVDKSLQLMESYHKEQSRKSVTNMFGYKGFGK